MASPEDDGILSMEMTATFSAGSNHLHFSGRLTAQNAERWKKSIDILVEVIELGKQNHPAPDTGEGR
jgi:hypothetical protein